MSSAIEPASDVHLFPNRVTNILLFSSFWGPHSSGVTCTIRDSGEIGCIRLQPETRKVHPGPAGIPRQSPVRQLEGRSRRPPQRLQSCRGPQAADMRLKAWILFLVLHINNIRCWNQSDWWTIHANISFCDRISCKPKDNDIKWQSEQITTPSATCRCDENCRQYADCCYDSGRFSLPEQFNSSSTFKCVDVVDTGVYMIAGCPLDWKDTEIEKACRDESWKDPLLALPVTSESNYVTYKNMHCAVCNNVTNFTVWDIDFIYVPYDDYDVQPDEYVKDNIFYNVNTSTWGLQYEDFIEVKLYPKMPKKLNPFVRQCRLNVTDECISNDTSNWQNYDELCKSYTFIVYDEDGRAYRNPYCALCNNVSIENLDCRKNKEKIDPIETTRTLTESINYYKTSPFCTAKQEVYDVFTKTCRAIQTLITSIESKLYKPEPSENLNVQLECEKFLISRNYYVMNDDRIFIKVFNKSLSINDVYVTENEEIIFCNHIVGVNPYYESDYIEKTISFVAYILSIFFLVLHLVLFINAPSKHKLAGKNNISFSISLIISYITLLTGNYFVGVGCYMMSVVSLYSLLASFMWMVVISYDIYRMVTSTRVKSQTSSAKRFLCYSCWGWLVPAFIVGLAVFADFSPLVRDDWKPAFGLSSCWFGQNKPRLAFLVAPLIAFTLLNTILFTRCAITIYIIKNRVKTCCKHSFKLYLRVALAMGLTWTFGLLSMSINNPIFRYSFVILNSFQGFFILISFWDQDIAKAVKGNFYKRVSAKFYISISTMTNTNSSESSKA